MFRKLLLLYFFCFSVVQAQTGPIQSDCTIGFTFTASGNSPVTGGYDNRQKGCVVWVISYSNTVAGFSPVTITLQSAPNNSGVPGTWATYAGQTVVVGANPSSSTTATTAWLTGYNPWVRVNAALTGSGTLTGVAYGWKDPGAVAPSISITPSGTQDVNLVEVGGVAVALGQTTMTVSLPVAIASDQSAVPVSISSPSTISTNLTQFAGTPICNHSAPISLSGSGNTQIVAASGTKVITVCHISLSTGTPENIQLTQGVCAGSPTALTGVYQGVLGIALDFQTQTLFTGAGNALCVNQQNAQTTGGLVTYGQN
jgi:hypothetical protein